MAIRNGRNDDNDKKDAYFDDELHFKCPAEFLLRSPGRNQIRGHDELLEVQIAIPVRIQGPAKHSRVIL